MFLHEPTTELMKAAEDVEHSHLLDEARLFPQPGSPAENSHRLLRGHKAHVPPGPAEYLAPTAFISACSIRQNSCKPSVYQAWQTWHRHLQVNNGGMCAGQRMLTQAVCPQLLSRDASVSMAQGAQAAELPSGSLERLLRVAAFALVRLQLVSCEVQAMSLRTLVLIMRRRKPNMPPVAACSELVTRMGGI